MKKKILAILLVFIIISLIITSVNPQVMPPTLWKKVGSSVRLVIATNTVGDSGARIAKFWGTDADFTDATIGTLVISSVASGGITISGTGPYLYFKDTDAAAGDVNASIDVAATDTGDGTEDVDVTFQQQVNGTSRQFLSSNADGLLRIGLTTGQDVVPGVTDGGALGSGTVMWSDLFLADGGVINFNNGDITITHATNLVAVTGGNVGIGVADPDTPLEILNAGNQLKLSFDGTDNTVFAVDTNGVLTITASGTTVDVDDAFTAGSITSDANVAGTTYGSDSSISDAELLTIDDGATTEILVGGGAGSAPVWTTATGTGAPVRANTPTLITPEIGVATGTSIDLGTTTLLASRQITVDTGGGLDTNMGTAAGDDFTIDTTAFVVEGDTGRIGIGTASPITKLDVAGSSRIKGTATSVLTGTIDPIASTTVTGVGTLFTTELVVGDRITVTGETRTVTAIASDLSLTVDTAFTDNANDLTPDKLAAEFIVKDSADNVDFIVQDNGNVGIGTTAPNSELHLFSNALTELRLDTSFAGNNRTAISFRTNDVEDARIQYGDSGGYLRINPGAGVRLAGSLLFLSDSYMIYSTTSQGLRLGANNTEVIRISSAGNVGIGTTAPGKLLEINGATGGTLRLTYNDADGSAADYTDFAVGANGDLTITTVDSDGAAGDITLTPDGVISLNGDVTMAGHVNAQEFTANAFQYPAPGTDWTSQLEGAGLAANLAAKKVWIPLNFLKIGDEIVSYRLVGDATEAAALTLDCKLVRINKANPLTTTDVTGGGITQITADGNFDSEAVLSAVETVATDKQYALEVLGTTGAGDSITVIGAEVKVNRK